MASHLRIIGFGFRTYLDPTRHHLAFFPSKTIYPSTVSPLYIYERGGDARGRDGEGGGRVAGGDGGAGHKRGVQDMEEEHALPVRHADLTRPRVAFPHRAVAPRPRGARREGLFRPEDDPRHPHLRRRAQLPHACRSPASPRGRRVRRPPVRRRARRCRQLRRTRRQGCFRSISFSLSALIFGPFFFYLLVIIRALG